jgi:uncharacterized protein YegL
MLREVIFVIDGSGSMANKATDVRGGFNTYVEELLKDDHADEYTLSATVFNEGVWPLFTQRKLSEVPKLTDSNYSPGGGTALYDAIADTLDKIKDDAHFCFDCGAKRNKAHKFCSDCGTKLNGNSAFTVIIMTDGEENSSKQYRKHHIVSKIQGKEQLGNWTFVYMGANQDAMAEGTALGIASGNTVTYNTQDTFHVYRAAAASTTANYAAMQSTGTTSTQNFTATASASGIDLTGKTPGTILNKSGSPITHKDHEPRVKAKK